MTAWTTDRPDVGATYRFHDGTRVEVRAVWSDGCVCDNHRLYTCTEFRQHQPVLLIPAGDIQLAFSALG